MAESKMPARRVMFCCESCADNYPEGCGYFDRDDLRVMPNGVWLCDGCFTDCDAYDYGFRERDEDGELVKPDWADLPAPPDLVRADLVEPLVEALRASQAALAMMTAPKSIMATSTAQAYAHAYAAECKARAALSSWEAGQ